MPKNLHTPEQSSSTGRRQSEFNYVTRNESHNQTTLLLPELTDFADGVGSVFFFNCLFYKLSLFYMFT